MNGFVHIALFVLACPLAAQTATDLLDASRRAIESHRSISYEAIGRWQWIEYDDTASIAGSCIPVRDTADRIFGGKVFIGLGDSAVKFYDMRWLYVAERKTRKTTAYNAERGQVWPIMGDLSARLVLTQFLKPRYLTPGGEARSRRLADTTIGGVQAYHVMITYPDEDQLVGQVRHLYISKQDMIPLLERYSFEFGDDPQFQERLLLSYRLDAVRDIGLEEVLSPGDSVETYVPPEEKGVFQGGAAPLRVGSVAPPLTGVIHGVHPRKDTLQFAGRTTLLVFWYADCIPCSDVLPLIDSLYGLYGARGLHVYGVNALDRIGSARKRFPAYLIEHPFPHPLLMVTHHIPERYGIASWPAAFLVDHLGIVRFSLSDVRYGWFERLEESIKEALDRHPDR